MYDIIVIIYDNKDNSYVTTQKSKTPHLTM